MNKLFKTIALVVAFIAGICLIVAEAISVIEALVHYWDLNRQYTPPMPEIPEEWYPEVSDENAPEQ